MLKLSKDEQVKLASYAQELVRAPREYEEGAKRVCGGSELLRFCVETLRIAFMIAFSPPRQEEDENEKLDRIAEVLTHSTSEEDLIAGRALALEIARSPRRIAAHFKKHEAAQHAAADSSPAAPGEGF